MATIAQFVIELTANAEGVKAGLDRGVGYLNQFTRTADQTFRGLGKTGDAYTAAETIVRGIEQKFGDAKNRLRESLFRGVITQNVFDRERGILSQAMNTTLLGALEAFRARGSFGTGIESLFVSALSDAGLKSGDAFASRFADRMEALGPVATKLGLAFSAAITAPVVAGGGLGIREAIEGEADLARLNLAFGASTGEVAKALDALHDRFPAQKKGLEEMAASTALLLRSVDIVGPRARSMALGLTEAAGVMGLIRTRDPSEVLEKMQGGLRGNVRALGEFGISIKPASLQIEAQRLGLVKHGQALDETRRAIAAYSLIQQRVAKEVANAAGFENLASNQLRLLKRDAIEAAEAFGRTLLPAFTATVRLLDSVAKAAAALPPSVLAVIAVVAGLAATIGPLLLALGGVIKLFGVMRGALIAASGAESLGAFLAGFTSLSAFVAAGGGLLIGLGLVLAAVLAIRSAMANADDDVAKFETSLAKLTAPQLIDAKDDLARQIDEAHTRRAAILAQSRNPGALGLGGGGALSSQLADVDEQITTLEQKAAAVGTALAHVHTAAADVADLPLPPLPVDEFKDFLANTNGLIDSLKLVEERYALITRNVDSAVTLQGFVNAQLTDQVGIVHQLQDAQGVLADKIKSGALTATERAAALREELTITKAIAEATDRSRLERSALAFATQKLGALETTGNTAALDTAFAEATQAAANFRDEITRGVIPATSANVAQLAALDAKILTTADVLDRLSSFRSPGQAFTAAERARFAGRDTFQASVAQAALSVPRERGETGAAFGNIGLGFQRELDNAEAAVIRFARAFEPASVVFGTLRAAVGGVVTVFRSVLSAISPFAAIMDGIGRAAAPLAPVLERIATVVADTLGPVFAAFAPVLDALIPLVRAIFQVLGPILEALAPLFRAMIPLLEALFPVFKFLAIVVTYLGQGIAIAAGVILKIVGGLAVAVGGAIAGIGSIISHIPFLGGVGRDIRDFGNAIKNFGHASTQAGTDAFAAADAFAKARGEIAGIGIDHTADAVDKLGDAANAATSALINVPTGYRVALSRFLATAPVNVGPATSSPGAPIDVRPATPASPPGIDEGGAITGKPRGRPGGADGAGAASGGESFVFTGNIIIDGSSFDPATLFDTITAEGKRRARSTPQADGSTPWYGVPG